MGTTICWLQDVGADQVSLVGGKAANLGRLVSMGLPVPPGFVATTDAYRAFLAANHLAGTAPEALRERILASPVPPEVSAPILAAYQRLGAPEVAVRSSATAEDLATASFAGQHDTFLNVAGPEALLTAVRACWASLWSPRAIDYRRERRWDDAALALAVVVQAMVPAEWAGVLFTADPVTGRRDRMIVEAVPGLGEALVSGRVSGSRAIVEKASLGLVSGDGALPREALGELARLGVQIEGGFGQPQDVEWACAGGRCYLLQARPLTALPEDAPQTVAREPRRYSRVQRAMAPSAVDHLPVPPYPFDLSLYFRPLMQRVLGVLPSLGFSPPALDEVYREVADGVVQLVPPRVRPTIRVLALPAKLPAALRADSDGWLAECRRSLMAQAERIDAEDLSALSERDLLERIQALRHLLLDLSIPRFAPFPRGMLASQGLHLLLRLAVGRETTEPERDLLADIPCATTEANRELGRLARQIGASEELRRVFREESPDRLPSRLGDSAAGRALLAEVDAFLRRYGRRETVMPSAALPAWRDEPSIVYGLLKGLVAGEPDALPLEAGDEGRAERARRAVAATPSRGRLGLGKRYLLPLFLRLLGATRAFLAFREDSHFYLMSAFPVIRRLALELGRRLAARGVLEEAEDVFFLEIGEIEEIGPVAEVREKARRRRRVRRAGEGRYTTVPAELLEQTTGTDEVRGVPVSPGQAVGRVRVILSEQDFWKLQKGEVLVARYTNPTWTPLFVLAAAVVVDAGGTASHAAIVAREYGIPAVMGAGNATARLRDGQRVLVDGGSGRVAPLGDGAD